MHPSLLITLLFALSFAPAVSAEEREGDYLYKVSAIRAAPGDFEDFIGWTEDVAASGFFEKYGEAPPMLMRHSQGDQWDILKIEPMESWAAYYSTSRDRRHRNAVKEHAELLSKGEKLVAFQEDHFAYGPPLAVIQEAHAQNDFYHIEMFRAAPGKASELLKQRRMENAYLESTGQTTNMIFRRAAGSDIDVFTIGYHESLEAFAAPSAASDEEKETAAKAAGFKDRGDISFYLRKLISGHHDTLAVKVE